MTFDISINPDKDIHLDGANDIALTSGRDRLEQSIAISVMDETQRFVGSAVTGQSIGFLEESIQQALIEDNDVESVQNVRIDTFDRRENRIEVEISVNEEVDFAIEVFA